MRKTLLASVALTAMLVGSAFSAEPTISTPIQYYQNGYYVPPGYTLVPNDQLPGGQYHRAPPDSRGYPTYPPPPGYYQGQPVPPPSNGYAAPYPPSQVHPEQPQYNQQQQPSYSPATMPIPPQSAIPTKRNSVGIVRTPDNSVGTGYVYHASNGETLIGTAYHVIGRNTFNVTFTIDSREIRGKVVYVNPLKDQAAIRLESTDGLIPAKIGRAEVGEIVSCYGYKSGRIWTAGNYKIDQANAVTRFQPDRRLSDSSFSVYAMYEVHTTNATPLQPGMSGGPCFNRRYEVVGFNSSANMATDGNVGYIGTPVY